MQSLDALTWTVGSFEQFDGAQWYELLKLRSAVFVVEQQCIYQDVDDLDRCAEHVVAWHQDDAGIRRAVACGRVVKPGAKYPEPSIGRVASAVQWREQGLGRALLRRLIVVAEDCYSQCGNRISAQLYLEHFYEQFGFRRVSDAYLEDGIPHIEMLRSAT